MISATHSAGRSASAGSGRPGYFAIPTGTAEWVEMQFKLIGPSVAGA